MSFITDQNDEFILDSNGDKIEYSVSYIDTGKWVYKHREPLHVTEDGNYDSRDKHIIIKDGIQSDHPISKRQFDNTMIGYYSIQEINDLLTALKRSFQNELKTHEANILTKMIKFCNSEIKNRIRRKFFKIPKTTNTWIKILSNKDIGEDDLTNTIIISFFVKRWDLYHESRASLTESSFGDSLEMFFNSDMTEYNIYFSQYDSSWSLDAYIEYMLIPKPVSIEDINNKNIPSKPESNK